MKHRVEVVKKSMRAMACGLLGCSLLWTLGCDIFESDDSSSSSCGVYPDSATSPARKDPKWEKYWNFRYSILGAFKTPDARAGIPYLGAMDGECVGRRGLWLNGTRLRHGSSSGARRPRGLCRKSQNMPNRAFRSRIPRDRA